MEPTQHKHPGNRQRTFLMNQPDIIPQVQHGIIQHHKIFLLSPTIIPSRKSRREIQQTHHEKHTTLPTYDKSSKNFVVKEVAYYNIMYLLKSNLDF